METIEEAAESRRKEKYIDGSISTWTKNDWQSCYKEGFIEGTKSDAARDYWFKIFKEQDKNKCSEKDLRNCYFSAIKSTGEGWNGEYAEGNSPCIEEMFGESFQDWYLQFKNQDNEQ
jgi:hypothetical protein